MPSMGSYLLENMVLDYYSRNNHVKASKYIDLELPKLFNYIHNHVFNSVNDPKLIQGNINNLNTTDKIKISTQAYLDYLKASDARKLEDEGKHNLAINKWIEIFGDNFPKYG